MKRIGHLFEEVTSIENCKAAIIEASDHKRKRRRVRSVLENIDFYASDLSKRIQSGDFLSEYTSKTITDKCSGKTREIMIPRFYPDQCAHHAVVRVIGKYIKKSSSYWSCANIRKRGLRRAVKGIRRKTQKNSKCRYCLKMDIRKFYPSINHEILKGMLRRKFKDARLLHVLDLIIGSCPSGIPIGNYTSPVFAELYLQGLDHMIQEKIRPKGFARYADDIVLLDSNKRKLRKAFSAIKQFADGLMLTIKGDWQIFRICFSDKTGKKRGRKIDFAGKCFGIGFNTVRKRIALAFMRQSRRIRKKQAAGKAISLHMASSFLSRAGCLNWSDSSGLKRAYYSTVNIKKLKGVVRNESHRKLRAS